MKYQNIKVKEGAESFSVPFLFNGWRYIKLSLPALQGGIVGPGGKLIPFHMPTTKQKWGEIRIFASLVT